MRTQYAYGLFDPTKARHYNHWPAGLTNRAGYFKYITETLGAKQQAIIVPECGHNDRCIFTTDIVFPAIFPDR